MIIDCDRCQTRGLACGNCAKTFLEGEACTDLGPAEIRALTVLANAGMIPPLRYAPGLARASLPEYPVLPESRRDVAV
jgi:hypothetical protein